MGRGLAVGVDLVQVPRFASLLERWPALLQRVFTDAEIDSVRSSSNRLERLAARFAAKEATFKALGHGWPEIAYRDVEVLTDPAPTLRLSGRAEELAGARASAVSLAHSGGFAIAEVVFACVEGP